MIIVHFYSFRTRLDQSRAGRNKLLITISDYPLVVTESRDFVGPPKRVGVRALAEDIVLCAWARHLTLTVPLSTQVYKWVLANLMLGVTLRWTSIPSRGSRNTLSRFMPRKPELSAGLMGPRGPNADFTFTYQNALVTLIYLKQALSQPF